MILQKQPAGVRIENLTKVYPSGGKVITAVDNVSLDIKPGEFVTLLGPSGCGKTTILRMVAGFEIPSKGDIFIGEQRVRLDAPCRPAPGRTPLAPWRLRHPAAAQRASG